MQSLLYGIVHWNEIGISIKQIERANDLNHDYFMEPKINYFLRLLEVTLDLVYIGMICKNKEISIEKYAVVCYVSILICTVLLTSKTWLLYSEYTEFNNYEQKICER